MRGIVALGDGVSYILRKAFAHVTRQQVPVEHDHQPVEIPWVQSIISGEDVIMQGKIMGDGRVYRSLVYEVEKEIVIAKTIAMPLLVQDIMVPHPLGDGIERFIDIGLFVEGNFQDTALRLCIGEGIGA